MGVYDVEGGRSQLPRARRMPVMHLQTPTGCYHGSRAGETAVTGETAGQPLILPCSWCPWTHAAFKTINCRRISFGTPAGKTRRQAPFTKWQHQRLTQACASKC